MQSEFFACVFRKQGVNLAELVGILFFVNLGDLLSDPFFDFTTVCD